MTVIIEIKDLFTKFGNQLVHNNISFKIMQGELIALMGYSGSGKSTLLDFIINNEIARKSSKGEIFWMGKEWDDSKVPFRIGFSFQNGGLMANYTTLENIAMPLEYVSNLPKPIALELAWAAMQVVDLKKDAIYKYPDMISGGMLKRCSIARAIALDQELILLDEPLSGLDPPTGKNLMELVRSLRKTIICITHQYVKADRYFILHNGSMLQGTEKELNKDPFARQFLSPIEYDRK